MLNHEDIYQLILNKEWQEILELLHTRKKDILSDSLLLHAANTFQQEFFRDLDSSSGGDIDAESLDILFATHHGQYYMLQPENFKKLMDELVKRKSLSDVVGYAKLFPGNDYCKHLIEQFTQESRSKVREEISEPANRLPDKWTEIYNRLFEVINDRNNSATYFSGPRFINLIKEFSPYFPDYQQFIDSRNAEGKSTSRKIFYYDILVELADDIRKNVIERMFQILDPFEKSKILQIRNLLNPGTINSDKVEDATTFTTEPPVVFISYSWDNEIHKEWVLKLANRLHNDGVEVILDRYYLKPGKSIPYFVEESISRSSRIIIIFTPNYKLKADKRAGGVGYEYSIMNADLYQNQTLNEKVIPLLRVGEFTDSIPAFMQQYIHIDIRNDQHFENSYIDLLREIFNEPFIVKPKVGEKPTFSDYSDSVEKPNLGVQPSVG